jgi:predicted anti-sigma-YlaC factor YlaD
MDCLVAREAMSAHLDGERYVVASGVVADHLANCVACREWHTAAETLNEAVQVARAEPTADLTPAILVAIGDAADARQRQRQLGACRWILAVCAVLQFAVAVPAFMGMGEIGMAIHLDHEIGCWDLGLAFGFLIAALQPSRAWGMLPLIFVVGTALGTTSLVDIYAGHVSAERESMHLIQFIGFVFTFLMARVSSTTSKMKYAVS